MNKPTNWSDVIQRQGDEATKRKMVQEEDVLYDDYNKALAQQQDLLAQAQRLEVLIKYKRHALNALRKKLTEMGLSYEREL